LPEFSVVLDWFVPPLLELEGRVDGQLLARALPESLGPLGLSRVLLLLEVLCAFRSTEFENLKNEQTDEMCPYFLL
jgi:hypothetical protein